MGNGWVNLKGAPAGQRKNFPESVLAFCRTAFLGSFFRWGPGCSRAIIFSIYNTTFRKARTPASLSEGGGADAPEGVEKTSESCFSFKGLTRLVIQLC